MRWGARAWLATAVLFLASGAAAQSGAGIPLPPDRPVRRGELTSASPAELTAWNQKYSCWLRGPCLRDLGAPDRAHDDAYYAGQGKAIAAAGELARAGLPILRQVQRELDSDHPDYPLMTRQLTQFTELDAQPAESPPAPQPEESWLSHPYVPPTAAPGYAPHARGLSGEDVFNFVVGAFVVGWLLAPYAIGGLFGFLLMRALWRVGSR